MTRSLVGTQYIDMRSTSTTGRVTVRNSEVTMVGTTTLSLYIGNSHQSYSSTNIRS